jgi:hypothetical protein
MEIADCKNIKDLFKYFEEKEELTEKEVREKYSVQELQEILEKSGNTRKPNWKATLESQTSINPYQEESISQLYDSLKEEFRKLCLTENKYNYFKIFEFNNVTLNDKVTIAIKNQNKFNLKKVKIVLIQNENLIVEFPDQSVLLTDKMSIRPESESSNLRIEHASEIYEKIVDKIFLENSSSNIIDYFYVFTDFFNLDEQNFFMNLAPKNKEDLIRELNSRTGFLGKKRKAQSN